MERIEIILLATAVAKSQSEHMLPKAPQEGTLVTEEVEPQPSILLQSFNV
jgi:hypothetical protein